MLLDLQILNLSVINISRYRQQLLKSLLSCIIEFFHMVQPLSKSHYYPNKGFLDDAASQTSSTITCRLTRKQDQRYASRRSSKNSSQRSLETLDIGKFYVRISNKEERTSQPLRPTVIKRNSEGDRFKRRSPTPVQSRKGKQDPTSKDQLNQIDNEAIIFQLQKNIIEEKQSKQMLERKLIILQKELRIKMKKIEQLERVNSELADKERDTARQLYQFQSIASINQNHLNEARNSLEKLKIIIKKNRYNQIQLDNNRLRKENSELKENFSVVSNQYEKNKEMVFQLENDLKIIKIQNESLMKGAQMEEKNQEIKKLKQAIASSKSQKEQDLQRLIILKSQSQMKLRMQVEKLEIQLAYLNRKKNDQIEGLKMKHGQLVSKMRTKLCILRDQVSDLREQNDKLKKNPPNPPQRRSLLLTDHRPTDDFFLFDLSP